MVAEAAYYWAPAKTLTPVVVLRTAQAYRGRGRAACRRLEPF